MAVRVPSFLAPILSVMVLPGRLPVTGMQSSRGRKILTGRAGHARHEGGDDGVLAGLELGAETAAHVVADDADVGHRQTEGLGEALLNRGRRPGWCPTP